jgi:hypothetical protein
VGASATVYVSVAYALQWLWWQLLKVMTTTDAEVGDELHEAVAETFCELVSPHANG